MSDSTIDFIGTTTVIVGSSIYSLTHSSWSVVTVHICVMVLAVILQTEEAYSKLYHYLRKT